MKKLTHSTTHMGLVALGSIAVFGFIGHKIGREGDKAIFTGAGLFVGLLLAQSAIYLFVDMPVKK